MQPNLKWTNSLNFLCRQTVNAYISCPRPQNLKVTPLWSYFGKATLSWRKKNAAWCSLPLSYAYCFIFRLNPLPSVRLPIHPPNWVFNCCHTQSASIVIHFLYENPQSSGGLSATAATAVAAFYFHSCRCCCFSFCCSSNSVTA